MGPGLLNIVSCFPNAPMGAVDSMCDSVDFVGLKVSYQAWNLEMKISENPNSVTKKISQSINALEA